MKKTICYFVLLMSIVFLHGNVHAVPDNTLIFTVKASPDSANVTRLEIINHKVFKSILHSKVKPVTAIPVSDTYVALKRDGVDSTYLVDLKGNLYQEPDKQWIELRKSARKQLMKYVNQVRSSHYGKLVPWDTAQTIIPKLTKFKVIDLESGLQFNVQRRAGKHHADVQPLSKEDTAVMKEIYEGKWSWRRKAILVQTGDQLLAASMHGMPHGGDGIPDNDFSGHFCIHFLGSRAHGSGNVDSEHQFMVRKAAGKWQEYLDQASPNEVVETFLTALSLKESHILKMSFSPANYRQLDFFLLEKDRLTRLEPRSKFIERSGDHDLISLEIPVEVHIYRRNRVEKTTFFFHMKRTSLLDPWKIDAIQMIS